MIKVFVLKLPWSHWLSQVVWVQDPDRVTITLCVPLLFMQLEVCLAITIKGIFYSIHLGILVFVSKSNQCPVLQLNDFAKVRKQLKLILCVL